MIRTYRALLRLLPRSFRDESGREMVMTFAFRLSRAGRPIDRARLWAVELGGLLVTAARLHAELLAQDLRWTFRSARRSPGFALTVVAVSSLGIAATTATVSVTDHVLVRPLPFPEPHRVIKLWKDESFRGYSRMEASPADARDWRERSASFESMASFVSLPATLTGVGEPERVQVAFVSDALGKVLGVDAAIGRLFVPDDDRPGAPATAVLSDAFWRSRFAGDRRVLGRTISIDGEETTVIGVLPAGLRFPERETRLWTPRRLTPDAYEDRDNDFLQVIARLAPGVGIEAARSELAAIAAGLGEEHPNPDGVPGIRALRLRDEVPRDSRRLLVALLAAALCLLVLACTNLAGLLLARSLARAPELALRAALGGGRMRLVRQMLTESLTFSMVGGALGVALAFAVTPTLARLVPTNLPISGTPEIDPRILLFAVVSTLLTGIGFGLAPALRASVDASAEELREGARTGAGSRSQGWRRALVGVEVALSVALVASCGLLLRALIHLQAVDPGFEAHGAVTLRTWLPRPEYESTEKRQRFYAEVLEQVEALPGVSAAGYTSFLPLTMPGGIWPVGIEGAPAAKGERRSASLRFVTPRALEALGVPLLAGRATSDADTLDSEIVAMVSESFARRYLPGVDPLGKRFEFAFLERTIVGVVGDVAVRGLGRESEPQVYLPNRQVPDGGLSFYDPKDLVVRAEGPLEPLVPALRRILALADPLLPVTDLRTLGEVVSADTAPRATQLAVLVAFASTALLLAGIGLHGLLAYTVSSRTREIGVRVALGASQGRVVGWIVRHALSPAGLGLLVGLALAAGAAHGLGSLLYGVRPLDPVSLAAAGAIAFLVAALGAALPTLRALRLDPSAALRAE